MMSKLDGALDGIRRLDPIDPDRLAANWSTGPAKPALLEVIMAAPEPPDPPRRRHVAGGFRRPALVLGGLVVVAAAAIALMPDLVSEQSPAYAVRQLPGGVLEVEMLPSFRDGEALQSDLAEYGIDAEVVTIVASPSMVGQTSVSVPGSENGPPPGLHWGEDGTAEVFQLTIDPDLFTGHLILEVAVAAEEGEPYQAAAEVFEPGEVLGGLHCALGEPLPAGDVAARLDRLGLEAQWSVLHRTADPTVTSSEQVSGVPAGYIVSGYAADASTVRFDVAPPGDDVLLETAYLSDYPCTPEQAAPWQ